MVDRSLGERRTPLGELLKSCRDDGNDTACRVSEVRSGVRAYQRARSTRCQLGDPGPDGYEHGLTLARLIFDPANH